jgi:IclR family transcriptional regulator, pca regulon regulatory protein
MSAPTPEAPAAEGTPETVGPLVRGLAVLRALDRSAGRAAVGDLARSTGLARSTTDRIAATLAHMGHLRLDGHTAELAPPVMALGNAYLASGGVAGPLGPLAERLADELGESVSLAVPDGDGIRFVHQSTRRRAMSLSFRVGDRLPAERTAQGTLFAARWTPAEWRHWTAARAAGPAAGTLFADLPPRAEPAGADFGERAARAGTDGFAVDDQLVEPGLIALALPVHGPAGDLVCAMSVVSHTSRHSARSLPGTVGPAARATAAAMERRLRETPPAAAPPAGLAEWTDASKRDLGAGFVESLARGLTVITAFDEGRAELTLTAVAEATGLARATARRALHTLVRLGYAEARGRAFRLTPAVLGLGFAPLARPTLAALATPHLAALVRQVHDSASLAVLDGDSIEYTARVATGSIMAVDIRVGTRLPAHATAMGRVLLAGLPANDRAERLEALTTEPLTPRTLTSSPGLAAAVGTVERQGYALVESELEEGLRSLAVPVRDRAGRTVAAVDIAMHTARRTPGECVGELLPHLRESAARIESDLHTAGRFTRVAPT